MNNIEELYELLEVDEYSTKEEIKKSYREKAKKFHPDLNKDSEKDISEVFKKINFAYLILIDDNKKEEYRNTGKVNGNIKSIEEKAMDIIVGEYTSVLNELLNKDVDNLLDIDILSKVRVKVFRTLTEQREIGRDLKRRIKVIQEKSKKVKFKNNIEQGMFKYIIDDLKRQRKYLSENIKLFYTIRKLLKSKDFKEDIEKKQVEIYTRLDWSWPE